MAAGAAVRQGVVATTVALYDGELLLVVVMAVQGVLTAGSGRHR